jgi:hypothetical protein
VNQYRDKSETSSIAGTFVLRAQESVLGVLASVDRHDGLSKGKEYVLTEKVYAG